ncbi:TSUP family transporter [Arthrobacter sp. Br18]|uniref:TSUP family transporter n=1 Tax=Arthrobacter sp. Br18 TaxID=1312954 RepID=UPI00047AC7E4|nr:TSUP family transporter [Arthrobacter sp. Br18]
MDIAVIAGLAVFIGTVLQRISGTGVGLVLSPVLALLLGPSAGILATNATTTISGFLIMLSVRRRVVWPRVAAIVASAALGVVVGAALVTVIPAAWLQIIIGTVVLASLALTVSAPRLPHLSGKGVTLAAGALGGLLNTTAGVAAPAMVIYAQLTRWEQRTFSASLQPIYMSMGAMSVIAKTAFGATGFETLPPWWVVPAVVGIVSAGILAGTLLERKVPPTAARTLAITLAGLGGAAAIIKGILSLV